MFIKPAAAAPASMQFQASQANFSPQPAIADEQNDVVGIFPFVYSTSTAMAS